MQYKSSNCSARALKSGPRLVKKLALALLLLLSWPGGAGAAPEESQNTLRLDEADIAFPLASGWKKDDLPPENSAIVLRLIKDMPLAGAPRVDFDVENKQDYVPTLKQFMNKNCRALADH